MDWSAPGFIEFQGKKTQLTITGKSHVDAPLIEFTAYSIKELLRFSKSALAAFRGTNLFEERKTILLGHSLGAVRAANIALMMIRLTR